MIKEIIGALFGIHVITVEQTLSEEAYDRMKKQVDDTWPKYLERPLLVEGGAKVTRL